MGSGSRLKLIRNHGIWFGIGCDYMPFPVTLYVGLFTHSLSIGFGRAYDKV